MKESLPHIKKTAPVTVPLTHKPLFHLIDPFALDLGSVALTNGQFLFLQNFLLVDLDLLMKFRCLVGILFLNVAILQQLRVLVRLFFGLAYLCCQFPDHVFPLVNRAFDLPYPSFDNSYF